MKALEGANCAGLPSFVIEKYFHCDSGREPLKAAVAKAICSNCVAIYDCRGEALNQPHPPERGIVAGIPASQIRTARAWRRYELGDRARPPRVQRPDWLPMTDATNTVEQGRLATDPDEVERP